MSKFFLFISIIFTGYIYHNPFCYGATSSASKILANPIELEKAKKFTKEAHESYKNIKFYDGGTKANDVLDLAINSLIINVTIDQWKECLRNAIINNICPDNIDKMSERWVKGYINFTKEILSILRAIAIKAEKISKEKLGDQNLNSSSSSFDHWTTLKDKEQ